MLINIHAKKKKFLKADNLSLNIYSFKKAVNSEKQVSQISKKSLIVKDGFLKFVTPHYERSTWMITKFTMVINRDIHV